MNVSHRAGYTHRISYRAWVRSLAMWVDQQFDTTRDAVRGHLSAMRIRMHAGEVSDVRVTHL